MCFGVATVPSSSEELAVLPSSEPVVALLASRGLFRWSRFLSSADALLGLLADDRLLSRLLRTDVIPLSSGDELCDFLGGEC